MHTLVTVTSEGTILQDGSGICARGTDCSSVGVTTILHERTLTVLLGCCTHPGPVTPSATCRRAEKPKDRGMVDSDDGIPRGCQEEKEKKLCGRRLDAEP